MRVGYSFSMKSDGYFNDEMWQEKYSALSHLTAIAKSFRLKILVFHSASSTLILRHSPPRFY